MASERLHHSRASTGCKLTTKISQPFPLGQQTSIERVNHCAKCCFCQGRREMRIQLPMRFVAADVRCFPLLSLPGMFYSLPPLATWWCDVTSELRWPYFFVDFVIESDWETSSSSRLLAWLMKCYSKLQAFRSRKRQPPSSKSYNRK